MAARGRSRDPLAGHADLLDEPPEVWDAERQRTTEEGWVAEMLTRRSASGWPVDYMRLTPAIDDPRAADALELLRAQCKPNGRWPLSRRIPGTRLVEMEKPAGESRWNTLRALRILRTTPA